MPIKRADGSIVPESQIKGTTALPTVPTAPILVPVPVVGPPGPEGPPGVTGTLAGDITGDPGANLIDTIQGFPIALTSPQPSDVLTWDGTKLVFGPPTGGVDFQIDSFDFDSAGALVEVGASFPSVDFVATYSVPPQSAAIFDDLTSLTQVLSSPFTSFSKPGPFTSSSPGTVVTFVLNATLGAVTKIYSLTMEFTLRRYYGVSSVGVYDEAFITGLSSSSLGASPTANFSATAGAGEYVFFCLPASYGTPTFSVGGFEGGFEQVASSVNVTVNGVTTAYDVWRSVHAELGTINVTVS